MSKPIIEILVGTGKSPWKTVELNREANRFLQIRLRNMMGTYKVDSETGKTKTTWVKTFIKPTRCKEDFF